MSRGSVMLLGREILLLKWIGVPVRTYLNLIPYFNANLFWSVWPSSKYLFCPLEIQGCLLSVFGKDLRVVLRVHNTTSAAVERKCQMSDKSDRRRHLFAEKAYCPTRTPLLRPVLPVPPHCAPKQFNWCTEHSRDGTSWIVVVHLSVVGNGHINFSFSWYPMMSISSHSIIKRYDLYCLSQAKDLIQLLHLNKQDVLLECQASSVGSVLKSGASFMWMGASYYFQGLGKSF